MKNNIFHILFFLFTVSFIPVGCDVAYTYDIESGIDEHHSGSSNVTVDTLLSIDVSMYDKARLFPGLVDTLTEERITTTLVLDMSRQYVDASTMGMAHVPEPIYSTGLYAGAGELVTITFDEDVVGLTAQIGSHTDSLTTSAANAVLSREPVVYTRKALYKGTNTIRNSFGGYIWITKKKNVVGSKDFKMTFSGVYKAPDYVSGTGMNATEWVNKINNTTVPWLELRSKHVAFSVSRARILAKLQEDPAYADHLEAVLNAWDSNLEESFYRYYGLKAGSPDPTTRMPDFPERVVLDVQLAETVYMRWSGQPIAAMSTTYMMNELTDFNTVLSGNSSAIISAFGNNYTSDKRFWWPAMQDISGVIPLYRISERGFSTDAIESLNDIFPIEGEGINNLFPKALSYAAADTAKWLKGDAGTNFNAYSLLPFVQLAHYNNGTGDNNWSFYSQFNSQDKEEISDSYFFKALCDYFETDFSPFFDHWGISIGDRDAASQYPLLAKTLWNYDPLSKTPEAGITPYNPTTYRYRHDRRYWSVMAFGGFDGAPYSPDDYQLSEGGPGDIKDGDKKTFWASKWYGADPHYLVIDMRNDITADGIYIVNNRQKHKAGKMTIQTIDAGAFFDSTGEPSTRPPSEILSDPDTKWNTIATIRAFYDSNLENFESDGVKAHKGLNPTTQNELFFEFSAPQTFRFVRIQFDKAFSGSTSTTATSIDQTLAEFGTFYYKSK
ncbi:hypothetical protein EZS27_012505 [termite gut metagenome]|uniref:Peptidase M60 domain-containing protein n=1 Tax=termite gut metagenome TaxID=433724 RepID=A0A5J4S0G6_9ZZZZ